MPALTVKSVSKSLSEYVRTDEDIVAKLNLVMPRIYALGMWRDLLFDYQISTTNDYFALPEHAESLLGVLLQDSPVDAQSQWHDYRISGYASGGPSPLYGVIDDGFHPTKQRFPFKDSRFKLKVLPIPPLTTLPTEGEVVVSYLRDIDTDGDLTDEVDSGNSHTFTMGGESSISTSDVNVASVTEVRFDGLHQKIRLVAENVADATEQYTLAEMVGDGVARYRRFRFQNSSADTKDVKLLLKRSWQPLVTENDVIYLGNLNVIKHGLLGMLAEDNADLERAQYHWTICQQLLDQELDATRGAAKPKVKLNAAGAGVNFNIPNIV